MLFACHNRIDRLELRHGDDFPEQGRGMLRTALMTRQSEIAALVDYFGAMPSRAQSGARVEQRPAEWRARAVDLHQHVAAALAVDWA